MFLDYVREEPQRLRSYRSYDYGNFYSTEVTITESCGNLALAEGTITESCGHLEVTESRKLVDTKTEIYEDNMFSYLLIHLFIYLLTFIYVYV